MNTANESGEAFVTESMKKHMGDTAGRLGEVLHDLESLDYVSETWKNRPKANIVKWLMNKSGTSLDTVAEYLGCSRQYLNNKLSRDSFSFDDLVIVAFACGYSFTLTSNDEDVANRTVYRVDVTDYFQNSDQETIDRIKRLEKRKMEEAYAQIEAICEKLKTMTKDIDINTGDIIQYLLDSNKDQLSNLCC